MLNTAYYQYDKFGNQRVKLFENLSLFFVNVYAKYEKHLQPASSIKIYKFWINICFSRANKIEQHLKIGNYEATLFLCNSGASEYKWYICTMKHVDTIVKCEKSHRVR